MDIKQGLTFNSTQSYFKFIKKLYPYLMGNFLSIKLKWVVALISIIFSIILGISVPLILREIVKELNLNSPLFYTVSLLAILYGLSWVFNQAMVNVRGILIWPVGEQAVKSLCVDLFTHLINLSTHFHLNRKTGFITSAIEKVQHNLIDTFWGLLFFIIPTSVELIIAALILWKLCGALYGLILLVTFTLFVFVSYKGSKWSLRTQAESNKIHGEASSYVLDALINISTIKYFNTEDYEINKCREILTTRENALSKSTLHSEIARIAQLFIIGIGLIFITVLSGIDVHKGYIGVGDFILINAYTLQFVVPLSFFWAHFSKQPTGFFTYSKCAFFAR